MKKDKIDKKKFQMTYLSGDAKKYSHYHQDVINQILALTKSWSGSRRVLEEDWEECWSHYFSNWRSNQLIERNTVLTVGNVENDYRHKVPTSKGYEVVETVNAYLQDAFFPTRNWFDLYPKRPIDSDDWGTDLKVMNNFIRQKLDESNFKDYWDRFIRQLCVVGTSVLALPWDYRTKDSFKNQVDKATGKVKAVPYTMVERNGFDFEIVDMFNFYIDPTSRESRKGDVIRRLIKTKGELVRLIQSGVFPLGDLQKAYQLTTYKGTNNSTSGNKLDSLDWQNGLTEYNENVEVEVLEFWGHLVIGDCEYLDVHAICTQNDLLVFEPNPYWGGKPFIIGTLSNGHGTPYGTGLLQPILGQLHQLYINQNHRLDVDEITVNPMWMMTSDGSLNPEDVYSQPGRVFVVEDPESSIVPIQMNVSDLQNTIQDEGLLEDRINKVSGIGDYVGVNTGRDAERVTAAEVRARQDAGGNRLSRYHKHLEDTALSEFLVKAYEYLKQFTTDNEVVRIQKPQKETVSDSYEFFEVSPEDMSMEIDIIPIGAAHVVDKELELREHIDFYTFMTGNPQLAQFMNWKEVAKDLASKLIKDDWSRFVILPEEQGSMGVDAATGQSPFEQLGMLPPPPTPQQGQVPPEAQLPPEAQPEQVPGLTADNQQFTDDLSNNPELAAKLIQENISQ